MSKDGEEALDLSFGQCCGRFVQDQNRARQAQRLGDFHHLLIRNTQLAYGHGRGNLYAESLEERPGLAQLRACVDQTGSLGFAIEKDIVDGRKVGNEASLLEHHADPRLARLKGIRKPLLMAVHQDAPRRSRGCPHGDLQQGRFASSISAQQGMDASRPDTEINPVKYFCRPEGFYDAEQFECEGWRVRRSVCTCNRVR